MAGPVPEGNIGGVLTATARQMPDRLAVVEPSGRQGYRTITFAELEAYTNHLAAGLRQQGLVPGWRMVLMVRPGIDFIALTFALFKAGAVVVLIDPGMGGRRMIRCLEEVQPRGFIAVPLVHAIRRLLARRFPLAQLHVSVGRGAGWTGSIPLDRVPRVGDSGFSMYPARWSDPAAIIFTTGSTGPAKGVLYEHGHFAHQVQQIRDRYGIEPGEVDLPGFPLFGLFNAAMGVTTVIPDMDPTRPARVDARRIVRAAADWKVTQAFGSPAMWNAVGGYCDRHGTRLPSIRRVLSAGAPVPVHVLRRMTAAMGPGGEFHTPYGATEALPVASISAGEVLAETAALSARGAGTCVGRRFDGIAWRVIRIVDGPIGDESQMEGLPVGEIGELVVRGPVVTRCYVTQTEANALAKIPGQDGFWHRMGDVGYLDVADRFWFCGRKAHRVQTPTGVMYTVPCEAVFNEHPQVYRSALVGVGRPGNQIPAMICQPWEEQWPASAGRRRRLVEELYERAQASWLTSAIRREHIFLRRRLPVDIRHNSKIFREKLAVWASGRIGDARLVG